MTMLDDDRLVALFDRAAATFEVPATGPETILARAAGIEGDEAEHKEEPAIGPGTGGAPGEDADALEPAGPGRRVVASFRRHRILSVAACVVVALIVAGVIGAAVRAPSDANQIRHGCYPEGTGCSWRASPGDHHDAAGGPCSERVQPLECRRRHVERRRRQRAESTGGPRHSPMARWDSPRRSSRPARSTSP